MKAIFIKGLVVTLLLFTTQLLQAQSFRPGDMVYFRIWNVDKNFHFDTPVYAIAQVKSVIGSRATLDTKYYLYQCSRNSKAWYMTTSLEIHRYGGDWYSNEYGDWYAHRNNNYQWSLDELKIYDSAAERKIIGGEELRTFNCKVNASK